MVLTWIYVEPAMMFPNQSGGISLYANEAWRKYTTFVGPIATFGYWIGWSVVLAIFGKIIGDLIVSRWFPPRPGRCTTASCISGSPTSSRSA